MKLFNVRRGQFVYYNNQLHKVYDVKRLFKRSVHLIRLLDYEQQLATAKEISLYKPKHLDSFMFNHQRFTLHKNQKAKVGDYILVIKPSPDYLDHHHLHAIEVVTSIERNGIISHRGNGIKHQEYWVMLPGLLEGAQTIDHQQPYMEEGGEEPIIETKPSEDVLQETYIPNIGDVFQKNDSDPFIQVMVVAIKGEMIYLGGDVKVTKDTLNDNKHWSFLYNAFEQ